MLFFLRKKRSAPNQSRPQATSGSGSATRRGPAAQAGRTPQSPESPFDFPDLPRGKINQNKKNNRVPQDAKSFAHKVRSGKTNLPVGFPPSCRSCIPSVQSAAVWAKKKERPSERTVFPMSGQWPRESLAACGRRLKLFWVETRVGHRVSRGDSASHSFNPRTARE